MGTPEESGSSAEPRPSTFRVRAIEPHQIDASTEAAWARLEERALEPNAYLSPHFVLPAWRHLESAPRPIVILVGRNGGDLAALGVFTPRAAARHFPLPHLTAYRSRHSYLTGLLVDRHQAEPAVAALFDFVCAHRMRWHGIEFTWRPAEGPLADLLTAAAQARGIAWHERSRDQRATLVPAHGGEAYLQARLSKNRLKGLRRQLRQLQEAGPVDWRLRRAADGLAGSVDRFLELEHLSWKGAEGTSMRSRPEDEAFFRETADGFAREGRVWFTELVLSGGVISSTCNFSSGGAGFAFKIGWDPAWARRSPGMLNEVELIRQAPELIADLEYLDSGAGEGSYIDEFWSGRRDLTSGMYATTALGRRALSVIDAARRVKRLVRPPG